MAADVEKSADLALRVTDDQNRVLAHVSGKEGAGLRGLALMAQEKPAAGEDPLQLLLVELRLDEYAATDQTLLGVVQPQHIGFHRLAPHWFAWLRRGTRSIAPASTVRMVPVMPLALFLELKKT